MGDIIVESGTTKTGVNLGVFDRMKVYGTVTRTSATSHANVFVLSGGTATDTELTFLAYINVENGGKAYRTVAGKGSGGVDVSSGGYASGIEAKSDGRVYVSSGGTAEDIVLNTMGSLTISSGGTANRIAVDSIGRVYVSAGGFASGVTVNSEGRVFVSSDGMASGVTVNPGGDVNVSAGGRIQDITVSSGGVLVVSSGGMAKDIIWTPFLTTLEILSGATVTYSDKMCGVCYGSGSQLISSAATFMSGKVVESRHVMHVMNSAVVNDLTVKSGGFLRISAGGTGDNILVESGGILRIFVGGTGNNIRGSGKIEVSSGATVNSVTLFSSDSQYGVMWVESGAVANYVLLNNAASLRVSSGGTASIVFNPFGRANVQSEGGATITYLERDANVYYGVWGQLISRAEMMQDLTMAHKSAYVYSGGGIYTATLSNNAVINVSDGGRADSVTLNSGGILYVSSGGTANDTVINNSAGVFTVSSGGIASRTTIKNGKFNMKQDGSATNVAVSSGGIFDHSGAASSVTVYAGGSLTMRNENAVANAVTISSGGSAKVYSGSVNGVTVSSGGVMVACFNGRVTGKMTFASGAVVSVYSGGVIDFDLTQTSAGASALLNDLSVVKGALVYTITVDGTQNNGLYNLAAGASGFGSKTEVSVRNTIGTELGTLTVNDAEEYVSLGGKRYSLKLNGASLYVMVVDDEPGGNVITGAVTGTMIISSGMTALGVDVNNGGWLNLKDEGTASNTTVNSGGLFYVSSGGKLRGATVVNGGGSVFITSDAVARDMILDGGVMVIESDAVAYRTSKGSDVATNTIVKNGGRLIVSDGGRVWGAYISSGGLATIRNGGEISGATVDKGELHAKGSASIGAVILRNGGVMYVSSGVSAYGISISSGGTMSVESGAILDQIRLSSGGILTGVLRGAQMISCYGGTADLNIANTAPDGEFLFDENTFFDPNEEFYCTLTVSDAQEKGTYNLMEYAYEFDTKVITAESPLTVKSTGGATLGTLTVGGTAEIDGVTYTLNLSDDYKLTVTISGSTPPPTPPPAGDTLFFEGDFNGDLFDTLAVQKDSTVTIYQNGEAWGLGVTLDPGWSVVGVGDFTGDGLDDFLRVNTEGYVVGEMSNGNGTFSPQVLNLKNAGWDILGTGDFNGNGTGDVLIANPTGASETVGLLGYWESGVTWTLINGYSPEWECVSTGDFNGDGKCDMLWKNSFVGDGDLTYNAYCTWIVEDPVDWRMVSVANPDEWIFLCSGDFDGNGSHDIAMINDVGVVGIWGVTDGYLSSWSILSAVTPEWQLAGVSDFNADGTDDIAWCSSTTGQVGAWIVQNKELSDWQVLAHKV